MVIRQILIIFVLILANGVFALAEAAVLSSRKARLLERADDGDKGAALALELTNNPNRFLSTTQFGITLISILAGAFGGATLTDHLAGWLARFPLEEGPRHAIAMAVVVGGITYVSLVVGELAPKRLALNNPESVAARMAGPMRLLSTMAGPVVKVLGASTDAVVRILGGKRSNEPPVTEEEINILIRQGAAAGVFLPAEQEMVQRVFRLGDRRVNELMVPRVHVVWLDIRAPMEESLRSMEEAGHERYPVGDGSLDRLVGVLNVRAVWCAQMRGEPVDLARLAWQPPLLPEELSAFRALDAFRTAGREMAVVLSEYGGVQGILTLADVLESLVSEIPEPPGGADPRAVRQPDGSWLLDGLLPAADASDLLDLDVALHPLTNDYETVGGLVMERLQRLPEVGDGFAWGGYQWRVAAMDGRRVAKVEARPTTETERAAPG